MHFLKQERMTLVDFLPGLDKTLAKIPLLEMENRGNSTLRIFRELGGPGLLIPTKFGGLGATPLQAIRIQRAIASRSPSLAVATTMHHFSVAIIIEMSSNDSDSEWNLLESIARQNLYLASGFAEGKTGTNILNPHMQAKQTSDGFLTVSGSKKPCSLSASMNFLTASVLVPGKSRDTKELAIVIIPATKFGIERRPFWSNSVLAGAESDEVILHEVEVPEKLIYSLGNPGHLDSVQAMGFIWFELLISASYLGVASALVERTLNAGKGTSAERTLLGIEVEGAMVALEGMARSMMLGEQGDNEVARALFVRYAVQRAIERTTMHALELLGGMAFVRSSENTYLFAAARALAFHPPSRLSISPALDKYLAGASLTIE